MRVSKAVLFTYPLLVLVLLSGSAMPIIAQMPSGEQVDSPSARVSRLDEPAWAGRHEAKLKLAHKGPVDLLFLGDSTTHNYERSDPNPLVNYRPVWDYFYGDRDAFDLGFSGDTTGNLLWRMDNGELAGLAPRLAVVLIGTNNTTTRHRNWTTAQNASAISDILTDLHSRMPDTRVLLIGILPSDQSEWKTSMTNKINSVLSSRYGHGLVPYVTYLDITPVFMKDGKINKSLFVEPTKHPAEGAVHPTAQGQALMAAALEPTIARLLGTQPKPPMPSTAGE